MHTDKPTRVLLALIAAGLFLNAGVALMPRAQAAAATQRVEVVNWPARLEGRDRGAPLPVYIMNGKVGGEAVPSIPVMVVNQRYN